MVVESEGRTLKTLASMRRSFDRINEKLLEALARLDEATARILALSEIHSRLAETIMDILGIPEELGSSLTSLPEQLGAISGAARAKTMASGLLRPIIRSLENHVGTSLEPSIAQKRRFSRQPTTLILQRWIFSREISASPPIDFSAPTNKKHSETR